MTQDFRQKLLSKQRLIGTIVTLDSPEVVEILRHAGYDWLFLDTEHAPIDPGKLQGLLQSAGNTPCIVRVPVGEEIWIKKALDAGAAGIVVPQVRNAEQVEQIVSWSKYPPLGTRGMGLARAQAYGFHFDRYVETANEKLSVVVQIEHFEAVDNIDAICAVEGLDAILIGPNDLAASYNKTGQFTDPEVLGAIEAVTSACKKADKCMGIFGLSAEAIKENVAQGYSLLLTSADSILLGQAGKQLLDSVRSL